MRSYDTDIKIGSIHIWASINVKTGDVYKYILLCFHGLQSMYKTNTFFHHDDGIYWLCKYCKGGVWRYKYNFYLHISKQIIDIIFREIPVDHCLFQHAILFDYGWSMSKIECSFDMVDRNEVNQSSIPTFLYNGQELPERLPCRMQSPRLFRLLAIYTCCFVCNRNFEPQVIYSFHYTHIE